jgi:xylose isomerase
MDAFAAGLKVAAAIRSDGRLLSFARERYASWQGDLGRRIMSRGAGLAELHALAHELGPVEPVSGRQEMLEDIVNQVTIRALR